MAMAVGLDAGPAEQGGGQVRAVSKRWIALFVALAAGWGILFGYSLTFLNEDMPFRPAAAALPEPPAFGFPPLPQPVVAAVQAPTAPSPSVAVEPQATPSPPRRCRPRRRSRGVERAE